MLTRGLFALVAATTVAGDSAACELNDQHCVLKALVAENPEALELLQVQKKKKTSLKAGDSSAEGDASIMHDSQEGKTEEAINDVSTENMISSEEDKSDEDSSTQETQSAPKSNSKSEGTNSQSKGTTAKSEFPTYNNKHTALLESDKTVDNPELGDSPDIEDMVTSDDGGKANSKKSSSSSNEEFPTKTVSTAALLENIPGEEYVKFDKMLNEAASKPEENTKAAKASKTVKTAKTSKASLLSKGETEGINSPETESMIGNDESDVGEQAAASNKEEFEKTATLSTRSEFPTQAGKEGKAESAAHLTSKR